MDDRIALSVPEAAAMLGISKTTMYSLIKSPDCDFAFMLGGRRLINRAKLEQWIDRLSEEQAR